MNTDLLPPKSFYDSIWTNGIAPEIINFLDGLNWFYILMFINILYGLKHTGLFNWYSTLLIKSKLKFSKIWISAIITAFIFVMFRWADPTLQVTVEYISSLFRSVFVVVIFSGVLVDIPGFAIKKLMNFLDTKDTNQEKKED
ncbi:MAG TPA: hypothetical protein VMZ91_09265 [Candidatus Paceibacterota bacterium]|nr:hypothetical protein [Candidatus Paceibacterota bacterium]